MELTKEDVQLYSPRLLLVRHTGALLMWFQNSAFYRGEPEKLRPVLTSVTIKNLIVGWWSPVSLFVNPVVTIANWVRFNKYSKEYAQFIATPERYITEARQAAQEHAKKTDQRFKKTLIALAIVIVLIIAVTIYGAILDS